MRVVAAGRRWAAVELRSKAWEEHRGWWVLGSAARTRCDWARSGKRSVESLVAEAVRRSRVGRVEARMSKGWVDLLLKQPMLETVALDRHSLVQCLDEGLVTLSQDAAEAGWEYEARGGVSSCLPAHHDSSHLEKHWADHSQNELDTDLQWGWADTAAGATAGHRARRGWQEVAAARRHRTWAVAVRHRARLCEQEQKPASGQTRG